MNHVWYKPGDGDHSCDEGGACMICSLSCCKVCGGMEGSLTTDCCGSPMPVGFGEKVYSGKLDFIESDGWVNKFGPNQRSYLKWTIYEYLSGKSNEFKSLAEIQLKFGATKEEFKEIKDSLMKELAKDYLKG